MKATMPDPSTEVVDPSTGKRWTLLAVLPGRPSPANSHRVNPLNVTVVEFFDAEQDREAFGPFGQYVSGYGLGTLISALSRGQGIMAMADVPAWDISALLVGYAIDHAIKHLHECLRSQEGK